MKFVNVLFSNDNCFICGLFVGIMLTGNDNEPEIVDTTVTPVTPRSPSTGLAPEVRRLDIDRPLEVNKLSRNVAMLNQLLTQSFGRVVNENLSNSDTNV